MSQPIEGTTYSDIVTGTWNGTSWDHTLASVTVVSGQNMLTLSIICGQGYAFTDVKFHGVAMTKRGTKTDGDALKAEIWDLQNPDVGTYDIVLTHTSKITGMTMIATPLSNVDATTPRGTVVTAEAYSSNATVTVTTDVDDLVIDIVNCITALTKDASQSLRYSGGAYVMATSEVATGTSTSMSYTNTSNRWCQVAVPYKGATGGGSSGAAQPRVSTSGNIGPSLVNGGLVSV